jgi:hypothetical protein
MAGRESDNDMPIEIGLDGWPVDRPTPAEAARAEQEGFEFNMRLAHSRWLGGNLFGAFAAVRLCWRHRQPPPEWLVDAVEVLVDRAMGELERRARREWSIHRERWEAFVALREHRHDLAAHGDDRGMSWEKARAAVSERLAGSDAAGSERTIKASYELIEKAGGDRATFASYLQVRRRGLKDQEI